jgi:pimeloyl-ACP methyl ester carboxylesterase
MAADVRALADHLGLAAFDLVGYSMGGIVSLLVAVDEPRVRRLVVGGIGEGVVLSGGVDQRVVRSSALAAALRADDPGVLADPVVRAFRAFADATGSDRLALAAQADAVHARSIDLAAIAVPALVLAGTSDPLATRPEELARAIPGAEVHLVPGDHGGTLRRPEFARAIVEFLGR